MKPLHLLLVMFNLLVVSHSAPAAAANPVTFYVAPDGNDAWSGRAAEPNVAKNDGPFATIGRAQETLRRDGALPAPVTIRIRGTHRLAEPLVITPEDSGTAETPVTFKGLRGGEADSVRRPADYGLAEGRVAVLAVVRRWFAKATGDLRPWSRLDDVRVVLMHSWETSIHPIKSIDTETNIVRFTAPMSEWWSIGYWEPHQRYYVENALEFLNEPGEWYLDRTSGVLSYMPLPDEDLRAIEVIAPLLTELVRLDGNAEEGRFVDHVALRGLTLHHADWELAPEGNSSTQAAVTVPAAVMATGARHCALEDCEIAHVGTYGVWLGRGCKENRIERNHIHDLGAGGVRIGEDRMAEHDVAEASRNVVTNNYIHDGGHVYAAGVGLWLAQSSHNTISHNEIHSFDYSGISLGWTWSEAPNRTHNNTIEYNYVHHVGCLWKITSCTTHSPAG